MRVRQFYRLRCSLSPCEVSLLNYFCVDVLVGYVSRHLRVPVKKIRLWLVSPIQAVNEKTLGALYCARLRFHDLCLRFSAFIVVATSYSRVYFLKWKS